MSETSSLATHRCCNCSEHGGVRGGGQQARSLFWGVGPRHATSVARGTSTSREQPLSAGGAPEERCQLVTVPIMRSYSCRMLGSALLRVRGARAGFGAERLASKPRRSIRCCAPEKCMRYNMSIDTDAQGRPRLTALQFLGRRSFSRYASAESLARTACFEPEFFHAMTVGGGDR